ncbi:MAG: SLC13 family permease [Alphaproteobacteria bacterium]
MIEITPQHITFAILFATFGLFLWGRWRYDVVAFMALLAGVLSGVVSAEKAFLGFGHPAVVTVAAVLVISRAFSNAGVIDIMVTRVLPTMKRVTVQISALSGIGAVFSMFMNNVGALALLMPVAIRSAAQAKRSPSVVLMPLSFASILGGTVTLIGTPPNIIVATFRGTQTGTPFGMFDFAPVGGAVAVVGVLYLVFIGWRLIPRARHAKVPREELFDIEDYVSELRVPKGSPVVGMEVREIEELAVDGAIIGLIRGRKSAKVSLARRAKVRAGDVLILEASPDDLGKITTTLGVELISGGRQVADDLRSDDVILMEAVVPPGSRAERHTANSLRLRGRHGVNLLAVSRQGKPHRGRLANFRFQAGDVILLQGDVDQLPSVIAAIGCLPLAERGLGYGKPRRAGLSLAIFAAAIVATSMGWLPPAVALSTAVILLLLFNYVTPREAYEAVDWPVIVLLAALIPIGGALQETGGTQLVAVGLMNVTQGLPPAAVLTLLLVVTMTLSDVINNAATAVVMAPIGAGIAQQLGVNADPFLMAVAIGASCAFLTPIGHQNNTLVMGPGGYRFGDYWRVGLPLEILIVAVSVPLLMWVWPL